MKKIIVKAIVKATSADSKTARIPFYKGINKPMTATTPTTAEDTYIYILRYTVETHRAVMGFPISWENACKKLYDDIRKSERFLYACSRDYWVYTLLYRFYSELWENPYIENDWGHFRLISNLWQNAVNNMDKNRPFYGWY